MNHRSRLILAITVLGTFSCAQLFAGYTITNKTGSPIQIYITGQGYEYISKGSKGNLAFDMFGQIDDPRGATRALQPDQSTDYSWDQADPRGSLPLQDVMVQFPGDPGFSKSTKDNQPSAGVDQTINITRDPGGKARIQYQ